jgi:hypothetical protein
MRSELTLCGCYFSGVGVEFVEFKVQVNGILAMATCFESVKVFRHSHTRLPLRPKSKEKTST